MLSLVIDFSVRSIQGEIPQREGWQVLDRGGYC
jgi:hypothetical protein